MGEQRIRIAVQKSGRLTEKSMDLLSRCGLKFNGSKDQLMSQCENFPVDLLMLRDDDIPEYVAEGTCELGIVGENVLIEKSLKFDLQSSIVGRMGFGKCRLSIAVPTNSNYEGLEFLKGRRIATSYPNSLKKFLEERNIRAHILEISGSVEIAPTLGVSDAICDLVSTGGTLRSNGLREVDTLLKSESVIVRTKKEISPVHQSIIDRLLQRIEGLQKADSNKYIMMNAPRSALAALSKILPGMEHPSIMPLEGDDEKVAVHAVCHEDIFWSTMEKLKAAGASSILVLPIEKMM